MINIEYLRPKAPYSALPGAIFLRNRLSRNQPRASGPLRIHVQLQTVGNAKPDRCPPLRCGIGWGVALRAHVPPAGGMRPRCFTDVNRNRGFLACRCGVAGHSTAWQQPTKKIAAAAAHGSGIVGHLKKLGTRKKIRFAFWPLLAARHKKKVLLNELHLSGTSAPRGVSLAAVPRPWYVYVCFYFL